MRATSLYAVVSVMLLALKCPVTTADRHAVLPRENSPSTSASAKSTSVPHTASSGTSQTSVSSETPTSGLSSSASKTSATSSYTKGTLMSSKSATGTSMMSAAASSFAAVSATPIPKGSLNVTTTNDTVIEGLPIQPQITPGLSVAGAIMILTGSLYTLIGIKTQWIHISASSAYLVSLAITVLIIYVMHPPISEGLQGAYVAAVIISGGLLGGLSLLFKDITEGFATFLGGFCLSMWFLVLKPGGLINNDVGKIIFIAFLTIGAFPLYISHHTRPYGLIGSTSFAGATVIVLGIDCFSRAGLKEFWLFIWSLNESLFPLHYHQEYPITRGIRVEIAAIIIISLAGVMSQLKVWKIVKQKREERASEQKRKEHQRNLSDEERGKKVESDNQQDQPLWEALHGGKGKTRVQERFLDSGVGTDEPSTRKSSWGDVRHSDAEGMELENMPGAKNAMSEGGRVTVHVAQDDFYETSLVGGQRTSMERKIMESAAGPSTRAVSETSSTTGTPRSVSRNIDPTLTLKPKVVPPPFRIPDSEFGNDDGRSSVEASAPSEHLPDMISKHLSGTSIMRKFSQRSRNSYHAGSTSEEALMIPHVDDDRASSLAATHDGVSDHGDSASSMNYSRSQSPVVESALDKQSLEVLATANHSEAIDTNAAMTEIPELVALPASRPASMALQGQENLESPQPRSNVSKEGSERIPLSGNLPDGGSKVVTAYRTNEWAKHLDGADVPDFGEISISKGKVPENPKQDEQAAPLDIRALQQTSLNAEPPPEKMQQVNLPSSRSRASKILSRNPFSKISKEQESPAKSSPTQQPFTIVPHNKISHSQNSLVKAASRTSSQTSLNSTASHRDSRQQLSPQTRSSQISLPNSRGYRSSSTPLANTPLVESPIEEGVESSFPNTRFTPHNAHLMSQRDRIITSKPSSTSLLRTSSSNVDLDQHPAFRNQEINDDIPLTQRKSLLQRQSQASPRPHRSSSGPSGTTTPRFSSGASTPMPRAPYRSSSNSQGVAVRPTPTQRDSTISAWHNSLKPDTTAHLEYSSMEARRADLLREKQRESTSRLEGHMKQGVRASVIDQGMRRGDMLSAHQAAMRKLQGGAKI